MKFRNAILCEHVVRGDRNKHTLVNVYTGDIVVSELPAKLLLGLYLEYISPSNDAIDIRLDITLNESQYAQLQVQIVEGQKGSPGAIVLPVMEVGIDADLVFRVVASSKGYRKTELLSKRIYKGAVAG